MAVPALSYQKELPADAAGITLWLTKGIVLPSALTGNTSQAYRTGNAQDYCLWPK
jgi:hypothetical protein